MSPHLTSAPSVHDLVHDYVRAGKLMQVASCDGVDGQPHLAHVWYSSDEDLNLMFMSHRSRVHSRQIRGGRRVAGGIVDIELTGLGQHVRGVTFEGRADEAGNEELGAVYRNYSGRWPHFEEMCSVEDIRLGRTSLRLYVVRPTRIVLFDAENFPDQPRQEISLEG